MSAGGLRVRWGRVICLAVAVFGTVGLLIALALGGRQAPAPIAQPPTAAPVRAQPATRQGPRRCPALTRHVIRTAPSAGAPLTVALTFDDGPGVSTDAVLKILADQDVRATFFVVGRLVAAHPGSVHQVVKAGHEVENHSWSHPLTTDRRGWQSSAITKQISRTQAEVSEVTGRAPCFFRPPGGVLKGAKNPTYAAGTSIVLWSVDPRD